MEKPVYLLSLLNLGEEHLARLREISPRLVVSQHSLSPYPAYDASTAEFGPALRPEVEILYTYGAQFDVQVTPHLRWVQTSSAGVDQLYNTSLWQSELMITNASGIHAIQIAEYVLTQLLASAHHLSRIVHYQDRSYWARGKDRLNLLPLELRGRTLGILGYGAIGREVARLASAFGVRVLATKRPESPASFDGWTSPGTGDLDGSIPERFYGLDELSAMLPLCDLLLLALPLSQQTFHVLGAAELALLQAHTYVVNIGRGALIDHQALVTALQDGKLGGVALDVTEPEPLPAESPLWQMENVLITPHISGLSAYYNDRVTELFCENVRRYLNQEPLLNLVQRERGY